MDFPDHTGRQGIFEKNASRLSIVQSVIIQIIEVALGTDDYAPRPVGNGGDHPAHQDMAIFIYLGRYDK